jgi:hypothetical protein
MTKLHWNERVVALCTLIAEEKDPAKFALLASQLKDALENNERKVERAGRTAKVSYISPQATPMQR